IKYFCSFLFFSLLLISFIACPSSSQEIQYKRDLLNVPSQHQVLYIKNTKPFFLNKQEPNENKMKTRMMMKRRKIKNYKSRPNFTVMLPKGIVPPSGSSSCHNKYPDSVPSYCDLSVKEP
ncbi:hypothetical protein CFOL_v3_09950, partial [Cephalotus follicularis]